MIINDFYPTDNDLDAQLGFEYTKTIGNIPVPVDFTNAYWVGWCTPDKLPSSHKLSRIDITDSTVSATPVTPYSNHDIGYVSVYTTNVLPSTYEFSGILQYVDGNTPGWRTYGQGDGNTSPDNWHRFPNKLKIYGVGCSTFRIFIHAFSYSKNSDYESSEMKMITFDYTNYADLIQQIENTTISFGDTYLPHKFDVKLNYFKNGNYYYMIENDEYRSSAYIASYTFYGERDIDAFGTLGGYSNIQPIISHNLPNEKLYTVGYGKFCNTGSFDIVGSGIYLWPDDATGKPVIAPSRSTIPCTNEYTSGNMQFSFDRKLVELYCKKYSNVKQYSVYNGNCVLYKHNPNYWYCYIGRCYQIDDVVKTIALAPRINSGYPEYGTGENISFPLFSDTNEFTGEMVSGSGIDDQLRPWQIGEISDNDYTESNKPEYVPDETLRDADGDDIDLFPDYSQAFGSSMNTLLVTSGAGIDELKKILSVTTDDFWKSISINGVSETNAITNYITSVKYFPFNITSYAIPLQITAITFGFNANAKIPISGSLQSGFYKMMQNYVTIDFGTVSVPCIYGERTFLDFEPYTTVDVYIPFCGIYKLSPNDVMGKTLYLTEIVDLHNGMLTAKLSTVMDGLHVELITATGNCSSNIPISGNDYVTQGDLMASAYIQGEKTFLNMAKSAVGAISANPMAIANGALNMVGNTYDVIGSLNAQTASQRDVPKQITSGSGFGNFLVTKQAYISIKRPRLQNPPNYGHVVGYSCNRDAVLETLTGYTVCRNVDTSGLTCTEHEKQMIKYYLESGVYL